LTAGPGALILCAASTPTQATEALRSAAVASPSAETIAQILAALNIRPRAYLPLLVGGREVAPALPRAGSDGPAIGAALLLVVGALWLWQRSPTSRM
jgi:hypothetical protein